MRRDASPRNPCRDGLALAGRAIHAAPRDDRRALPRHDQPRPGAPCADCLAPRCAALANPAWTATPCPAEPRLAAPSRALAAPPGHASLRLATLCLGGLALPSHASPNHAKQQRPCRAEPRSAQPCQSDPGPDGRAQPCPAVNRLAKPGRHCRAMPSNAVLPKASHAFRPGRATPSLTVTSPASAASPSPAFPARPLPRQLRHPGHARPSYSEPCRALTAAPCPAYPSGPCRALTAMPCPAGQRHADLRSAQPSQPAVRTGTRPDPRQAPSKGKL